MSERPTLTVFVCDPERSYIAQLQRESDEQLAAYERELDVESAFILGQLDLLDAAEDGCDPDDYLPFYAERPYQIIYPEIFEP